MIKKKKVIPQMKALRVTEDVHTLAKAVTRVVAVETNGKILNMNDAIRHVFEEKLDKATDE